MRSTGTPLAQPLARSLTTNVCEAFAFASEYHKRVFPAIKFCRLNLLRNLAADWGVKDNFRGRLVTRREITVICSSKPGEPCSLSRVCCSAGNEGRLIDGMWMQSNRVCATRHRGRMLHPIQHPRDVPLESTPGLFINVAATLIMTVRPLVASRVLLCFDSPEEGLQGNVLGLFVIANRLLIGKHSKGFISDWVSVTTGHDRQACYTRAGGPKVIQRPRVK